MNFAYVDSSVWINRLEGLADYQVLVHDCLASLRMDGWELCVSEAIFLEVLVKPYRHHRKDLITMYRNSFDCAYFLKNFGGLFEAALHIAQSENLKALDAIHVAFAIEYGCELFITTDPDFRFLKSLPVRWIDLSRESP